MHHAYTHVHAVHVEVRVMWPAMPGRRIIHRSNSTHEPVCRCCPLTYLVFHATAIGCWVAVVGPPVLVGLVRSNCDRGFRAAIVHDANKGGLATSSFWNRCAPGRLLGNRKESNGAAVD